MPFKTQNEQNLGVCEEMKKAKSVKSEKKNEKGEKHSPIVTQDNHPSEALLEKAAKNNNKQAKPKKQAEKQQPKEAEVKSDKFRWVKTGFVYRCKYVTKEHPKLPKTYKPGQTRLVYEKTIEGFAKFVERRPYVDKLVGSIERFNVETGQWEALEEEVKAS